jgi:hypothetical protein
MSREWILPLHHLLGVLVVGIGAWLAWDSLPLIWILALMAVVAGLLSWKARTIGLVWGWTTLLLGIESLAWPFVTIMHIRQSTVEPTDEQMGMILSAVVAGLFSAVFWISFSYGLFTRADAQRTTLPLTHTAQASQGKRRTKKK